MHRIHHITTIFALLFLSACSRPQLVADLPSLSPVMQTNWVQAETINTRHYQVTTNTGIDSAQAIGELMEEVYAQSARLLAFHQNDTPGSASVYAYATRNLYEQQVSQLGLPAKMTTGFYSPAEPAGIHLPMITSHGEHPYFTLVHEGFHQYAHEILGYAIAGQPGRPQARLSALPLWFNEGMALYLEAALVDSQHLQPGKVHPSRLAHLQKLLRQKKVPSIETVLKANYGGTFSNDDYSVAWGLVHALQDSHFPRYNRESFLKAWQTTVEAEGERLRNTSLWLEDPVKAQQQWNSRLTELSPQLFQSKLFKKDDTWTIWGKIWQTYILQLTSPP